MITKMDESTSGQLASQILSGFMPSIMFILTVALFLTLINIKSLPVPRHVSILKESCTYRSRGLLSVLNANLNLHQSGQTAKLWEAIEAQRKEGLRLCGNIVGLEEGLGIFKEKEVVFASY
mgnify:CR=1 FL=1|tara:strand:+ start:127 stop:489 length:363 start_codon:yes stop_codon:yes gene_type:complete